MKKLNYTVDGKKYMLFTAVIRDKEIATRFADKVQRFNGICTFFDVKNSFFSRVKATITCLIPEHRAVEFSNSKNL